MKKTSDVELILVGNELLKGERHDAHAAFIGNALMSVGVIMDAVHIVGDGRERISRMVRERAAQARVLIVCGGLGPTHDDITREGVADGLGLCLAFDESEWQKLCDLWQRFGRDIPESNRRQAYFPEGAVPMANPVGSAAGFTVERDDLLVAVLPGPPRELQPMVTESVLSRVDRIFVRDAVFKRTFRTTGIPESSMTRNVQPIFDRYEEFDISSLPGLGGVDIVLTQKPGLGDRASVERRARDFEDELRALFGRKLYAVGQVGLDAVIGEELARCGETLAIAESLTGGLIGKRMTDVPGSSRYVLADIVAYNDAAKTEFLAVSEDSLRRYGAVSEAVCREMADGVRARTGATWALAATGIAGPTGATEDKPLGLTYYGLVWDGGADIRRRIFPGDRVAVRERVLHATLQLLYEKQSPA